jgi:hypothetical protein
MPCSRIARAIAGMEDGDDHGWRGGGRAGDVAGGRAERIDRHAARRILTAQVSEDVHERYVRLVRELRGEHVVTSMTEVVNALLYLGPSDAVGVRDALRAYRRARHGDL